MAPGFEVPGRGASRWAYPGDLARFVMERWEDTSAAPASPAARGRAGSGTGDPAAAPPDVAALEEMLAVCYQASMLREEERPVTFRAVLAEPDLFSPRGGPPEGLQRLEFPEPRSFAPGELRRLSMAASFHRSLIGAKGDATGNGLRTWGLIHSGPRWLRDVQGGRGAGAPLPPVPVVKVAGPGRVEVYKGQQFVGRLEGGDLSSARMDVFDSRWLPEWFRGPSEEVAKLHGRARARAGENPGERWAPLDRDTSLRVGRRMMKRVISVVRDAHHGGTVLFVPSELASEFSGENPYLDIKYPFAEGESRWRYRDLIVGMLERLSRLHATSDGSDPEPAGWAEFETTDDGEIGVLDEALFEQAHLISDLAATDGAVVMGMRNELLGFGAEISGRLPAVWTVSRALDLEGERTVEESAEEVGTRHRSAYRLCGALPGSLAVVISQDGGVRFVRQKDGRVTYWDQD
ncbi:MAG: hypothetical protein AVDCRST_MAG02-1489 [uncultured Rubrobacteraceae bacterium]|uniref:Probable sensor domain-containing protein n=1 Tax=uncultured Rubrobacteraceae bacterium TaxID=349277 RepID=A0A6J4QVZ0_9ACTN|nr:MAG: hypothetical protein AVDCRST_MAG02-1489 [uncultured Rubrobacteraceae bacterium]